MIVLIILPGPFNKKWREILDSILLQRRNAIHIRGVNTELVYLWEIPFFELALQIKLWLYIKTRTKKTKPTMNILDSAKNKTTTTKQNDKRLLKLGHQGKGGWSSWTGLRPTNARWCWPRRRETAGRAAHSLPPPGRRTWWVAQIASCGSCLVLWKYLK